MEENQLPQSAAVAHEGKGSVAWGKGEGAIGYPHDMSRGCPRWLVAEGSRPRPRRHSPRLCSNTINIGLGTRIRPRDSEEGQVGIQLVAAVHLAQA